MSAKTRRWLFVLVVLLYACALQGVRPLYSPDEGRYTNVALNMLESGDWLKPMLHPEVEHWAKPPLTYWSVAASIAAFGRTEFAARLPGALAFAGTVLLMVRLGRRFVPEQPWLPALTYATFAFPPLAANLVTTDTLLTLWETLQAVALVELWWAKTPESARRARLLLGLAAGLAFMTKGPPGLLVFAASALFALISSRGAGLRRLFGWDALLVFLVVGGTWYAVVMIREPGVMHHFLVEEVVNRVATDKMHRNAEWYGALKIYLPTVLLGMLPWLPVLLRTWWRRRSGFVQRLRANDEARLLACWLLLPLAVFMLARSRLPLYLLPLFVPLALIAARALAPLDLRRGRAQALLVAWCAVLVLARAIPAYLDVGEDDRAVARALLAELPAPPNEVAFVETDARYGLHFYLDSEIERLELPGDGPRSQAQDIQSEMEEHEGCRVMLVSEPNLAQLEAFLAQDAVKYKRLPNVRGYAAIAQITPDCGPYAAL
ncbi:MAG TPA: glycosyltransferase family 39 protein [Rhodanobacteraceae bacterium]|jgi:4-amino-4-deoxy-L-arabinose transferase|nr:glycosyltransferase family 39 protein [Rhodanobacteraceae bacterium]